MTEATTPKQSGGRERGLERDIVVHAALKLLNEVGFSKLTLRRLADCLKVKASALYWHFENKQDLIDAMAEQIILAEFKHVHPASASWRDLLTMVAHTHRRALCHYRDGAQLLARANMHQSNMLEGMEQLFQRLEMQGFSTELATASFFAIIRYNLGCVFEEQTDSQAHRGAVDRTEHWKSVAGAYPAVSRTLATAMSEEAIRTDQMFESGLTIILDGIAHSLEGERLDAHPEGSLG